MDASCRILGDCCVSALHIQGGWENVRLNFQELRYILSNTQLTSELPHRRQNLLPR